MKIIGMQNGDPFFCLTRNSNDGKKTENKDNIFFHAQEE
jgi:hypothetical protein